jgi:hypothetical protein
MIAFVGIFCIADGTFGMTLFVDVSGAIIIKIKKLVNY